MTLTYDTWQANKDRPVWVRGHREALDRLTAADADPVPDAAGAVHLWVERYDGVVSRALTDDDTDTDTSTEVSDES